MSTSGSAASFSLTSSSERAAPPSAEGSREDDLRRALRHHARALRALRGSAYETLSEATRSELITKLESDWSELKQRLRQLNAASTGSNGGSNRGTSVRSDEPTEGAFADPPAPPDNDSWMQRLTSGFRS